MKPRPANENEGPGRTRWQIGVDAVGVLALIAIGAVVAFILLRGPS